MQCSGDIIPQKHSSSGRVPLGKGVKNIFFYYILEWLSHIEHLKHGKMGFSFLMTPLTVTTQSTQSTQSTQWTQWANEPSQLGFVVIMSQLSQPSQPTPCRLNLSSSLATRRDYGQRNATSILQGRVCELLFGNSGQPWPLLLSYWAHILNLSLLLASKDIPFH